MISKKHELHDEAQKAYVVVYEADGIQGEKVHATVPREERRASFVMAALLRAGADLVDNDATRSAAKAAIEAPAPIYTQAASVGWRSDDAFVSAFKVHGGDAAHSSFLPPADAVSAYGSPLKLRGDLRGWQALASIASGSRAMILCLAAAFAAPLLAKLGWPSFALMLYGKSRSGKSTAQWLGASAYGFVREEDMPNLNATLAGLLAMAMASKDHALFLNEAGTAGSREHVYKKILQKCYAILGGRDMIRHRAWSGFKETEGSFQNILVISSELHPDEWADRAGAQRDPGEMVRLIGVPATAAGEGTIFDNVEPGLGFATWADETFARLRNELPQQVGQAFEAYLAALVQRRETVLPQAHWYVDEFRRNLPVPAGNAIGRDIVGKFGVLYAGAMTAIDCGIFPLDKCVVAQSLKKACLSSIESLPDPQNELAEDISRLVRLLLSGSILDRDQPANLTMKRMCEADGIRERVGEGEMITLRFDTFKRVFPIEPRRRRLLEYLDDEGNLQGKGRRSSGSEAWAVTQHCWLERYRPRSIRLFLAKGMKSLCLK